MSGQCMSPLKSTADRLAISRQPGLAVTIAETEAAHRFRDARHLHRHRLRLRHRRLRRHLHEAPARIRLTSEILRSRVSNAENPEFGLATTAAPIQMRLARQASPPGPGRGPEALPDHICKPP